MENKVKNDVESSHLHAYFYSHALSEFSPICDVEPLIILALRNPWIHHLFLQQKNSLSCNESSDKPLVREVKLHVPPCFPSISASALLN